MNVKGGHLFIGAKLVPGGGIQFLATDHSDL